MCKKCGVTKEETKVHLGKLFATFPGIISSDADLRINNGLAMFGKNLPSDEIQEKMCQQITESRIQTDCILMSPDVFTTPNLSSDAIVISDEQKPTEYRFSFATQE
jgi:hypothetical protein